MKKNHVTGTFLLFLLLLTGGSNLLLAGGGDAAQQPMYMVCEYRMSPAQAFTFDDDIRKVHEQLKKHGFPFEVNVFKADDYFGYKVYTLNGFSDVDRLNAFWDDLPQKMGRRNFDNLFNNLTSAKGPLQCSFWFQRDDLSYLPEKSGIQAVSQNKQNYVTYQFYFFEHGNEKKAEHLFKSMAALYNEKGINTGFSVLEANVGAQRLTYILCRTAQSPKRFQQMKKETEKNLGADGVKSLAQINYNLRSLIRTYKIKRGAWQPGLRFKPGQKKCRDR